MKMTFQEIRIIATGPCIANQLRDVNTICRRSWYIAVHIWKIYNFNIEVVPFIINFSTDWTHNVFITLLICFYTAININIWLNFKNTFLNNHCLVNYNCWYLNGIWTVNNPNFLKFWYTNLSRNSWMTLTFKRLLLFLWIQTCPVLTEILTHAFTTYETNVLVFNNMVDI